MLYTTACTTASQMAVTALEKGDHCSFCQISASSTNSDHYSINNLALCYENGWCGYTKDLATAINHYKTASRWNIPQAIQNLQRLNIEVPSPDLYEAKVRTDNQVIGKLLGAVVVGTLAVLVAQSNNYNPRAQNTLYQPNSVNGFFLSNTDHRGCCSYHGGIWKDINGNPMCHLSGMIMCNDLNPSPSCACFNY